MSSQPSASFLAHFDFAEPDTVNPYEPRRTRFGHVEHGASKSPLPKSPLPKSPLPKSPMPKSPGSKSPGQQVAKGAEAFADGTRNLGDARLVEADEQPELFPSFFDHGEADSVAAPKAQNHRHGNLTIAVVMPVYNGERFLRESIQSVLDQTLLPDEFIIIDDGSSDGSHAIVEEMSREYPITFIRKRQNSGQSASRNHAIRQCKSDLIALIDQDDRWYPNHLEELLIPFAAHRNGLPLGWTYSDFDDIDECGLVVARSFIDRPTIQNPKRDLVKFLAQGAVIQPSATLISRAAFEAVGGFDENLSGCEDDDLFLRMFRANYHNAYIPQPLSQWRIYDWSSGASDRLAKSQRYFIRKLMAQFPDDKWRGIYYVRDIIAPRFVLTWAYMYVRAGRYKDFKRMREYAWDMWKLIPYLRLSRGLIVGLAFPILFLWPRLGELLLNTARQFRYSF